MRAGAAAVTADELPVLLRQHGQLRQDGYPLSRLLEWLPQLPTPVHPDAWATLVVAGAVGRQVRASGDRLQQHADAAVEGRCGPGRLFAAVAAQRAALAGSRRRWADLPTRWRATLPCASPASAADQLLARPAAAASADEVSAPERALLEGLVAAPQLFGRIAWLQEAHFSHTASGEVFGTLRRLHEFGHAVDAVTLTAALGVAPSAAGRSSAAALARDLRPQDAIPTSVPFLARHVLARAIVRDVRVVGEDLVRIAEVPAAVGGIGGPLLSAAQDRLDGLRTHALRWENATGGSRGEPMGGRAFPERALRGSDRQSPVEAIHVFNRHAG